MLLEYGLLVLVAAAYRRGLAAMRALPAGRRTVPPWRAWLFAAGLVVVAGAASPPMHALAHTALSGHMIQHVLLVLVAAPLLGAGAPQMVVPRAVPGLTRRLAAPLHRRGPGTAELVPAVLVGGTVAHLLTLWLWHAPVLYDAAVHHDLLHALEHMTLLGTALAVWSALLRPGRRARLRSGLGVLCIWLLLAQGGVLAALIVFAREPMYGAYPGPGLFGLDPLADQQLAGLLMWIPGGMVYGLAGVLTFIRWFRTMEAREQARDGGPPRPAIARAPRSPGDPAGQERAP